MKITCMYNIGTRFKKGRIPWNKGLTKETDEKVAKQAKQMIGEKNPHFGIPHSKEFKLNMSLRMSGKNNPRAMLGKHRSKETIEKQKISWRKNRDKNIRNILKSCCKHPNKFEIGALNYLNIIYSNNFKYVGNGTMIVNGRSADAFSKKLNTIALFHGIYWHLKKFKLEITEENKRAIEKVDSLPFINAGYKVIFIWEDEFNSLIKKLTNQYNKI